VSPTIDVNKVQEGLQTRRIGARIIPLREVGSTNDYAKKLAAYDAGEGTVVVAETQTAGHGRRGRRWISPRGGLWFSLILRPEIRAAHAAKLVFVAGLAVAETLRKLYGLKVETKWPNDVLVDGRKICGILSEMNSIGERITFVTIGIGINANFAKNILPEELGEGATSLMDELGRKIQLEKLLKVLLENLETTYEVFKEGAFDSLLSEWKKYAAFLGRKVEVEYDNEKLCGVATDIDDEGALLLKLDDGTTKRALVADVSIRTS
jgi:BirA family biotin operon repressor/biotin-[acetyl-CoA-carboxylase] ligase